MYFIYKLDSAKTFKELNNCDFFITINESEIARVNDDKSIDLELINYESKTIYKKVDTDDGNAIDAVTLDSYIMNDDQIVQRCKVVELNN